MTTFISPQALSVYETVAPTGVAAYAWLLILIPLASAGLLLLLGRASDKWGHLLATLASWSTFVVGALIAAQMWNAPVDAQRFGQTLFTWIPAGDFTVDFGLLVDPLAITFVILVTFVGSLIHSSALMRSPREVCKFFTNPTIRSLAAAGKYFSTYICPTTSPKEPSTVLTARFQRGCISFLPDIVLL